MKLLFNVSLAKEQIKKIKNNYWGLVLLFMSPTLLADIPTPPSDLQISSGQSFFKVVANMIVEEVLPLVLPGVVIVLAIYSIWGLLTAMQAAKKSGDWGEFKTQAIFSAIAIVLARTLGYYAFTLGSSIDVQS